MKKKIIVIIMAVILVGVLTACVADTSVEDYQELVARFREFSEETELTVTSETRFELLDVDGAVLNSDFRQVQADGMDESIETMRAFDENGSVFSEVEITTTGGMGYINMDFFMPLVIEGLQLDDEYMEALGITEDDLSQEAILGNTYSHIQLSDETFAEMIEEVQGQNDSRYGLYGAFSEEELEEYLSYNDGVFRIEVEGESVRDYIDTALEITMLDDLEMVLASMMMLVDIDVDLVASLEDDFGWWLSRADLEEARLIIELEELRENNYQQHVELYIPERVSIVQTATIAIGESTTVSAPNNYITEEDLTERMTLWFTELMIAMLQPPVDEVTEEPSGDAPELEPYILVSGSGEEVTVAVISGARVNSFGPGHLDVDAGAITIYYELNSDYNISEMAEALEEEFDDMMEEFDELDMEMGQIFPAELSADGTTLFVGFNMEMFGASASTLIIAQDVPNSDYVLITIVILDGAMWTQEDTNVLTQLSAHFGVDLMRAIPVA